MHTTAKEIDFITGLITGEFLPKRPPALAKNELLKNYVDCAIVRRKHNTEPKVDWTECIKFAIKLMD